MYIKAQSTSTSSDQSDPSTNCLYGFTGQETDAESDLMFYDARYYDPTLGRFVSEDPIGFTALDTNLYRYTGNNPINYVDPTGLEGGGIWDLLGYYYSDTATNAWIGVKTAGTETAYYFYDVERVSQDLRVIVYSGFTKDLGYEEVSTIGRTNKPSNPDFWAVSFDNAGHVGMAALTAGGSEILKGTYSYYKTGDLDQAQQQLFAVSAGNLVTAGGIKASGPIKTGVSRGWNNVYNRFKPNRVRIKPVESSVGSQLASKAGDFGPSPRTPVGRSGQQHSFPNPNAPRPRNSPTTINGRAYSGHAIDRMQERGFVPSVVENAIRTGTPNAGRNGTVLFTDRVNNTRVIVDSASGRVVTIIPGG